MRSFTDRSAVNDDASFIASLVAESSGGVWPAVWKALAKRGETVESSAIRYLTDSNNDLWVGNAILMETGGAPVGVMISYQERVISSAQLESDENPSLPVELDEALRPYRELSDPDSLFIAEICFLKSVRGKGLGTLLLEKATDLAAEAGLTRLTLRVFSTNARAVRLYERFGFEILAERLIIPHPDIEANGTVYLMSYQL